MVNIYWVESSKAQYEQFPQVPVTREYKCIYQGLENNKNVLLVDNSNDADFTFCHNMALENLNGNPFVYIDGQDRLMPIPRGAVAYFIRNCVDVSVDRIKSKKKYPADNWYPLQSAILDEFCYESSIERDIDLGCYLRVFNHEMLNRQKVMETLEREFRYDSRRIRVGEINNKGRKTFDKEYNDTLRRTKILVNCSPDPWNGDWRVWESLAAGCLTFIDEMFGVDIHPFIDEKHCIFYDVNDMKGLIDKIKYYMKNEKEANEIAKKGHNHALKYHRSTNRIDEILMRLEC